VQAEINTVSSLGIGNLEKQRVYSQYVDREPLHLACLRRSDLLIPGHHIALNKSLEFNQLRGCRTLEPFGNPIEILRQLFGHTFVQKKQKRLRHDDPEERGDQYVWIALDSKTKLVMTYHVGKRDGLNAYTFIADLDCRIVPHHRFQITTDGLADYIPAIEEHFGADVDFAQLVKSYAAPVTSGPDWFRPSSRVTTITKVVVAGDPDDCNMRMHTRRLTRLTNGFSKKLVNLQAAIAIFMTYFNLCRVHQTLRVTPAMEAGLTDHVWSIRELLTANNSQTRAA
jgi:hypothetical protein